MLCAVHSCLVLSADLIATKPQSRVSLFLLSAQETDIEMLPYFAVYHAHFSAQISEGRIRMCIIHGSY